MARKPTRKVPESKGVASMVPGVHGFDAAADAVLAEMQRRQMQTTELANASGVSRVSLTYWLKGQRPLRADYLLAVLVALNLTLKPADLAKA
ncbi:MAG: hypothetical protein AMXMBFR58_29390 [Phycisphaerae bacterium]